MAEKSKTKQIIIFSAVLVILSFSSSAFAALETNWPKSPMGTELTEDNLTLLIKYLYEWGISLGGFAVFVVLVIAGFQYLTSVGNAGKMQEAMSRIKSAVVGLILLLSAVLVLNTINPRLTEIKMPDMDKIYSEFALYDIKIGLGGSGPCEGVRLYPGEDFSPVPAVLDIPGPAEQCETDPSFFTINSVRFKGGACQLELYKLRDYGYDEDNPPIYIFSDVRSITSLSGGTPSFQCLKLIDVNASPK